MVPLLLHFDVNKTILLSDSLIMKGIEDGIREGIAELFWGTICRDDTGHDDDVWEWTGTQPSVDPPTQVKGHHIGELQNYQGFCKAAVSDKDARKKSHAIIQLGHEPKHQRRDGEVGESWIEEDGA